MVIVFISVYPSFFTSTSLRQKGLKFETVFCFIYKSVSYLSGQVSIVAAKYGSIFVDVSIVTTTCLLKLTFSL